MTDFAKSAIDALAAAIATGVPALTGGVRNGWPTKNQALAMPCGSVLMVRPGFTPCTPYLVESGTTNAETNTATNLYVVGQYDCVLQVDIWAKNKPQRASLFQSLLTMLHPVTAIGYNIRLSAYFNQWASFTVVDSDMEDDEDSATRQEWRARVELAVACRAVRQATDYVITKEPGLTLTTPDTIELD